MLSLHGQWLEPPMGSATAINGPGRGATEHNRDFAEHRLHNGAVTLEGDGNGQKKYDK